MKKQLIAVGILAALALLACDRPDDNTKKPMSTKGLSDNGMIADMYDGRDALAPENQIETDADRKITQLIRESLVADDTLSLNGKNTRIITRNGIVTLRGSVDTNAERNSIARKASAVSGVQRVNNLIEAQRS